jgi:hypothetical protein
MPTPSECEAFWNELMEGPYDPNDNEKSTKEKWPDEEDRQEFYKWMEEQEDKIWKEFSCPLVGRKDLIDMIAKMDYNSETDREKLISAVERIIVPWIPVGERNGIFYRIVPGVRGLRPDRINEETDRELVSFNVLGVNTNVQPGKPTRTRTGNLSEMSTKSNESDDLGTNDFAFHQIGTLEY